MKHELINELSERCSITWLWGWPIKSTLGITWSSPRVHPCTIMWKTALDVRTKIFGPTTPPRTLVVGKPRTLFRARAQRVLGFFTKAVVSVLDQPVRNLPFVPIATQVSNLVDEAVTVCEFGISQVFNPNPNLPRPPSSNIMLQGKGTILGKDTCAKKWGRRSSTSSMCALFRTYRFHVT